MTPLLNFVTFEPTFEKSRNSILTRNKTSFLIQTKTKQKLFDAKEEKTSNLNLATFFLSGRKQVKQILQKVPVFLQIRPLRAILLVLTHQEFIPPH